MEVDQKKPPSKFACSTCSSSFTRREHLQRHLVMHGSARPFLCNFCLQNFGRRDVLKRHMYACKFRIEVGAGLPELPQRTRGKKRTACHRCGSRKIACSGVYPCTACVKSEVRCVYPSSNRPPDKMEHKQHLVDSIKGSRVTPSKPLGEEPAIEDIAIAAASSYADIDAIPSMLENTDDSINELASFDLGSIKPMTDRGPQTRMESSSIDLWSPRVDIGAPENILTQHRFVFQFLKRSTMPLGLAGCFECGSLTERQMIIDNFVGSVAFPATQNTRYINQLQEYGIGTTWSLLTPVARVSNSDEIGRAADEMRNVTMAIVSMIKEATLSKTSRSKITMVWSQSAENSCYAFFSDEKLRQNLELFWSCWYPNFPAIHRPTFSPITSSPILVATMAIIGACLSPRTSVRANANLWFSAIEEIAFENPLLQDDSIQIRAGLSGNKAAIRSRLEAVQAAFMSIVFQNWEGSKLSRRRVRYQSYATILAAARGFGLHTVSRRELPTRDFSEFSWSDYILVESLIRTGQYIFLLEFAFVIFHNLPPRVVVPEMRLSLTSPEECFQADSADQCFLLLYTWTIDNPEQSCIPTSKATELICSVEDDDDSTLVAVNGLSALNLFIIISALHCIAFHLHLALPSAAQFSPVKKGLDRWIRLWNQRIHGDCRSFGTHDMWKRLGFMRHAPEYWLLTQTIVDRMMPQTAFTVMSPTSPSSHPQENLMTDQGDRMYDDNEMDSLKAIINEFQAVSCFAN